MRPIFWLLGLSGSGKTTLGSLLYHHLKAGGHDAAFIDGDCFRRRFGFSGFSPADRHHNIDAMRAYAMQLCTQGKTCIVAAITPYAAMRQKNREQIPLYREIWIRCSLQTLIQRDTKGLYAKAARGEMERLSGVSDTFDEPLHADLVIDTDRLNLEQSWARLLELAGDEGSHA